MEDATEFTKFKVEDGKEVDIPIPIPEDVEADEFVSKLYSLSKLDICLLDEIRVGVMNKILEETKRVENKSDDEFIKAILESGSAEFIYANTSINKEKTSTRSSENFANKFAHLMHSSSGSCLMKLMKTEQSMAKEMSHLTRTRAWEVEALARECDNILQTKSPDLHPYQLNQINDKLKQVHSSYACQIAGLIDSQRKIYRSYVDRLYTSNGTATPPESETDYHFVNHNECTEERKADIDESFTVYIGAQLKSMHNVRLISCDNLSQLCSLHPDSKLQTAMSIYGRTLSGLIMLVRKHPSYHVMNRTEFAHLCEQTTELHFDTLSVQLDRVSKLSFEANSWRETNIKEEDEESAEKTSLSSSTTDCLNVGDVYCTKHSNLSQQVVFHIVGDDQLGTSDISSRHPVLNGIRNVIRTADRISLTNIYIPLLLIEHATESTTVAWCIRRAEMVYKCVKGYLMEVCGAFCGGSPNETQHYNINFVVPNGLSPNIYQNLRSMLPTIFHLVPGVSLNVPTTLR